VACTSDQLVIDQGFPQFSSKFENLLESVTELRETIALNQFTIKDVTKIE
jgi:hypothetical protein